jgi:signal transduction histidine kinase
MHLKTKFILVSLVGGLSSVGIIGAVSYINARKSIEQAVGVSFQAAAQNTAKLADHLLHQTHATVNQLSRMRVMEEVLSVDRAGELQVYLMNLVRVNDSFVRITAINRHGEIIASSDLDEPGGRFPDLALVKQALTGQPHIDDVHLDKLSQTWVTTIAYPIPARYDARQVIGVLCAQWRVTQLSELLELGSGNESSGQAVQVMILRKDGLLIASSHLPRSWLFHYNLRSAGLPSATIAPERKQGYLQERDPDGRQMLVGYDFSAADKDFSAIEWTVLVRQDAATVFAPIRRLWDWVIIVAASVTLGVLLLSVVVSDRLSVPIVEIATAAERVAGGDFDVHVQRRSSDEVGTLARSFNQMIDDLKSQRTQLLQMNEELSQSNEQLKTAQSSLMHSYKMETVGRLAAGVAHEVKNPLTVITMGIEYLATDFPDNGDKNVPVVLKEMRESTLRADSIIRGLLDFSASNRLAMVEEDLNSTIEQSLQLVRHELMKNRITVDKHLHEKLPHLKLNRTKMEQVFINLFMNALHAMPGGGTLSVRTYVQQLRTKDDGSVNSVATVVVEVGDTGTGIPAEALSKVFEPFFTTKPAGVGTGLGLPVVKNIVELHGGTITMANRAEGGAQATLTFKAEIGKLDYEQETHLVG